MEITINQRRATRKLGGTNPMTFVYLNNELCLYVERNGPCGILYRFQEKDTVQASLREMVELLTVESHTCTYLAAKVPFETIRRGTAFAYEGCSYIKMNGPGSENCYNYNERRFEHIPNGHLANPYNVKVTLITED